MFLRPRRPRRPQRATSHETQIVAAREIDIGREIEYIMRCAAVGETHIVGLGPLVLFCASGSAWIIDAHDSLAYRLMNDYAPRPSPLRFETQEGHALAWEATFALREGWFWTLDEQKATAHHAFPAAEIARAVAAARRR